MPEDDEDGSDIFVLSANFLTNFSRLSPKCEIHRKGALHLALRHDVASAAMCVGGENPSISSAEGEPTSYASQPGG